MVAIVGLTVARSLGFDLAAAVGLYSQQLAAHAHTVDQPGPTAHPLVEQIVQFHGGEFVIEDDVPAAAKRAGLVAAVNAGLQSHLAAISSPARRALAQFERSEILAKAEEERSPAEHARLAEISLIDARSRSVQRHAALLQVEIEDLLDGQLDDWLPHGWPV